MFRLIAIRLLQFPLVLAIIYLLTFLLAWVAPGSPFERTDRRLDPRAERVLKEQFHADQWYRFLGHYPLRLLKGDFGPSFEYSEWSVNEILRSALPVSVSLGLLALTLATFGGVSIGTLAAMRRGGLIDWVSLSVALIGVSLPSFVTATVLLIGFCVKLRWFPLGGWGNLQEMILPAAALSLTPMAYIARLTRVSMIEVLSSDYVRTARAKGLSRRQVIARHCLRNAFLPVMSYLGPAGAAAMTGSFVVEKVFNVPGLGQHFVNGILNRDQTLILGTVMVYSAILLGLNLLVDVGYAIIDPRIELGKRSLE